MKILVTGNTGQLGSEMVSMLMADGANVTGIDSKALDFCQPTQVKDWISAFKPDWVINCAAYTNVDLAEQEQEKSFTINCDAARSLAEGVRSCNGRLVHISTDYIFDGRQSHPYSEEDKPNPLGSYGRSKLAGEEAVLDVLPDATIVRTGWVYGVHGNNFVKTILNLAAESDEIRVVDDQLGSPTWTNDIAKVICYLVNDDVSGVYNFTNEGVASWYDLAYEVVTIAARIGYPIKAGHVRPIPASDYTTLAERPHYSVLDKRKIRTVIDYAIPHWRESLANMMMQLRKVR